MQLELLYCALFQTSKGMRTRSSFFYVAINRTYLICIIATTPKLWIVITVNIVEVFIVQKHGYHGKQSTVEKRNFQVNDDPRIQHER